MLSSRLDSHPIVTSGDDAADATLRLQ